jgi:ubiquinone/menaquinone biosynthesis C-methylase UbiE
MKDIFASLFSKPPVEIVDGDYYFGVDEYGDSFDDEDADLWLNGGALRDNWEGKRQGRYENFKICDEITDEIAKEGKPFLEISCGPGMGLAPVILAKNPKIPCLAADACSRLIKAWRSYIGGNLTGYDISLASFNTLDIPIRDDALDCVTSFLGIGSTRNGMDGQKRALSEVRRVLKPGGMFVTVEGEFTDFKKVDEVFALWGRENWYKGDE